MNPSGGYLFLEHTADLKFRAYGSTLSECFKNAALALSASIADPGTVEEKTRVELELKAENPEELLHDFLSELLFLFETENLLFSGFELEAKEKELSAELSGEIYDPEKHRVKCDIKAVTYHGLKVEEKDGSWSCEVLCDV